MPFLRGDPWATGLRTVRFPLITFGIGDKGGGIAQNAGFGTTCRGKPGD